MVLIQFHVFNFRGIAYNQLAPDKPVELQTLVNSSSSTTTLATLDQIKQDKHGKEQNGSGNQQIVQTLETASDVEAQISAPHNTALVKAAKKQTYVKSMWQLLAVGEKAVARPARSRCTCWHDDRSAGGGTCTASTLLLTTSYLGLLIYCTTASIVLLLMWSAGHVLRWYFPAYLSRLSFPLILPAYLPVRSNSQA
jgi:hypothetical protein